MSRAPRTVASPRRFAVTMQCNTLIDLIFVDANTTAEARDQARSKCGDGRVLATRVYRKGMSESIFDPHGVLAREREAQLERHALSPGERRVLDAQLAVAHLIRDVAKDLYTLAESHRRSRDEVPSDFGGPYQRNAQRLDAIANAYDDAAKRVEALLAKLPK
jgi:hypothetical protein